MTDSIRVIRRECATFDTAPREAAAQVAEYQEVACQVEVLVVEYRVAGFQAVAAVGWATVLAVAVG